MNRKQLKFSYTVDKVLAAVNDKISHHSKRLKWYSDERVKYDKELREKGLHIEENIAAGFSPSYSDPRVTFDQVLLKKFNEAQAGVGKHRDLYDEFRQWKAVLVDQPENKSLELDIDDIEFFGLVHSN